MANLTWKMLIALWVTCLLFWPAWAWHTFAHPPFCPGLREFPDMAGACRNLTFATANLGFIPVVVATLGLKIMATIMAKG